MEEDFTFLDNYFDQAHSDNKEDCVEEEGGHI